jgi:hypothetical protein
MRIGNYPQIEAETVTISRYGAKLRIGPFHRKCDSGERIQLCLRGGYNWRNARVAWTDRVSSSYCGIELEEADNFWGVAFPTDFSAGNIESRKGSIAGAARVDPAIAAVLPPVTPSTGP